ncbi:hypothetical protein CK228_28475 [Mesorhizobium sp. WSM4312]|nr:hypothetical protein CK228_28475 [Mesorhizobium sp. WSM4312]PBC18665.1 hypothetical protein CK226_33670 [Mesorhizobium sp. WSM4311]
MIIAKGAAMATPDGRISSVARLIVLRRHGNAPHFASELFQVPNRIWTGLGQTRLLVKFDYRWNKAARASSR